MMRKCWVWLLVYVLALGGCLALAESDEFAPLDTQPQEMCEASTEETEGISFIEVEPEVEPEPEPVREPEPEPESEPDEAVQGESTPDESTPDAGEDPPPSADPVPAEEVPPEQPDDAEQAPRPDLAQALFFWQDTEVELCYVRDEQENGWNAQPLPEPIQAGVYVTNTSDCALGPIVVQPDALSVSDEGGLFSLNVMMEPGMESLFLESGESVRVATYTFSGQGGTTDDANAQTLFIGFSANYAD